MQDADQTTNGSINASVVNKKYEYYISHEHETALASTRLCALTVKGHGNSKFHLNDGHWHCESFLFTIRSYKNNRLDDVRVKHRSEVVQCRVRHVLLSNDIIQIIGCNFTEFQSTKCSWWKAGNGGSGRHSIQTQVQQGEEKDGGIEKRFAIKLCPVRHERRPSCFPEWKSTKRGGIGVLYSCLFTAVFVYSCILDPIVSKRFSLLAIQNVSLFYLIPFCHWHWLFIDVTSGETYLSFLSDSLKYHSTDTQLNNPYPKKINKQTFYKKQKYQTT